MPTEKIENWQFGESTFVVDFERRDDVFDPDQLIVLKSMSMLEHYIALGERIGVRAMVELGIYQGGSTAFFYEAFAPERLIAFDHREDAPALERFIARRSVQDAVRTHYRVDQADKATLLAHTKNALGSRPLDLVVDDASHFYAETLASFEVLFPLLRPGGVYVIEDWNWAHYGPAFWANTAGVSHFIGHRAPTDLVVELVKAAGSASDVISEVRVNSTSVELDRGTAELDPPFDLRSQILEHDVS